MSYMGVSFKNNAEQTELIRLIYENHIPIVFCTGKAGTGKTFTALAAALQLQSEGRYGNIIYARNPVQLGEDMGFLPGDLEDKYTPFMGPLKDNLESIASISNKNTGKKSKNANELEKHIECTPIAFLRGRSFENTILIIDEAQNLDLVALKACLTRFGRFCKVILLASLNQIDNRLQNRQGPCDFEKVLNKLKDKPYVGYVELKNSMRSDVCTEIDDLLGEIK